MKDLAWLKEEVEKDMGYKHMEGDVYYVSREHILGLIDQVEQPELPVIPDFIANQFETMDAGGVQSEFSNIKHILSAAFSGVPEKEEHYSVLNWVYNNPEKYTDAARYGYTVREKKYLVKLPMLKGDGDCAYVDVLGQIWVDSYPSNRYHLTESEINNTDPRYMAFAVPVEEVE